MKNSKLLTILSLSFVALLYQGIFVQAEPLGTAFTYQGRLIEDNKAADGSYDLQFKLYDNVADGNQIGSILDANEVDVIDGYFTVLLDFGSSAFNGDSRWLEIEVRPGELEDPNLYTSLSPRQKVTPAPYAIYAKTAGTSINSDSDWIISGNNMYSGVSGNVGIGTTTPARPLSFADAYGDKISIWGQTPGGNCVGFGNQPAQLQIYTDGSHADVVFGYGKSASLTETMRIKGTGNVGIGTASPSALLHVEEGATGYLFVGKRRDTGSEIKLGFQQPSGKAAIQSVGGDNAFILNPDSGNVGIGTTTPARPLSFADAYGDKISIWGQTPGDNCVGFGNQPAQLQIYTDGSHADVVFGYGRSASLTETMRIKGTGNVGIGTSSPLEKLQVAGTVKADNFTYSSAKIRYFAVPSVSFATPNPTMNFNRNNGWISAGTTSTDVTFMAPIYLPHGAKIVKYEAYIEDSSAAQDLHIYLIRQPPTGSALIPGSSLTSSGSPGTTKLTSPALNETVDNSQNAYLVESYWTKPPEGATTIKIFHVHIFYEISNPLP